MRSLNHMLLIGGEESASGSAKSKKIRQFVGSIFQTAKVLIMERPSVELAVTLRVKLI